MQTTTGAAHAGVLQFEVPTLELLGAGGVKLIGGTIQGTGSNVLDNDGNTIAGYGLIKSLTLENGDTVSSTINANVSGQTLTLQTGNTIHNESLGLLEATAGGTLAIKDNVLNAGHLTASGGTVALVGSVVTSSAGFIDVLLGSTLELQNATIDDGSIVNHGEIVANVGANIIKNIATGAKAAWSEQFTNDGTLKVTGVGTSLVLDTDTIDNSTGVVQIDNASTLTLSTTTIHGGTINDGTLAGDGSVVGLPAGTFGTIHVTGNSTIDSNASLNNGAVNVDAGVTLILNDVTVTGSEITDANATTSVIQVDNTHTLTINGTTIHGGTINDGTLAGDGSVVGLPAGTFGTIHVTGNSAIDSNASLNNGAVNVDAGVKLILNDVTVTGSEITDTNATTSVIQVDNTHTLTINGTTIHGGTINDGTLAGDGSVAGLTEASPHGTIVVSGNSTIDSGAHLNNGVVTVAAATTLILNDVTVTGSEITDTNATTSIIQVDNTHTLTINGTTIHGGTINDGTLAGDGSVAGLTEASPHGTIVVSGNTRSTPARISTTAWSRSRQRRR